MFRSAGGKGRFMNIRAEKTGEFSTFGKTCLVAPFLFALALLFGAPQAAHAQGKTIMVIAPHPDDEALCCSGVIYSNLQAGNTVIVVVVTNGDDYTSPASKSAGLTREGESVTAMNGLGVITNNIVFLGYGDQTLQELLLQLPPLKSLPRPRIRPKPTRTPDWEAFPTIST